MKFTEIHRPIWTCLLFLFNLVFLAVCSARAEDSTFKNTSYPTSIRENGSSQQVTKSVCHCLLSGTCIPSDEAIIVCREGASVKYFHRSWMQGKQEKVEHLYSQLQNLNPAIRTTAITDLGIIGTDNQKVIRAIVHALQFDESKWVRRAAAKTLGRLSIVTARYVLQNALKDRDIWVAHSAKLALEKLRKSDSL